MVDQSKLDKKYFINNYIYNCPFCNRGHVSYTIRGMYEFDWSENKKCYAYFMECQSCGKKSMHLSYFYKKIISISSITSRDGYKFSEDFDVDSIFFYSTPTSFFVIDERIPCIIRELITEAEGCLKMNYLTGASACMRKAIYELLIKEGAVEKDYEKRIKSLKEKYRDIDSTYFDILANIQNMTSDKIHEQSWKEWDSSNLELIIETLKSVLHEIYVVPEEKKERSKDIQSLIKKVKEEKERAQKKQ